MTLTLVVGGVNFRTVSRVFGYSVRGRSSFNRSRVAALERGRAGHVALTGG